MPEIVEVCITSQYLDQLFKNSQLKKISILGGKYKRHGSPKGLNELNSEMPLLVKSVNSKGKLLYFELYDKINNKTTYISNSFGLEGKWSLVKLNHANISFTFEKDKKIFEAYYVDHRNFGNFNILTPTEMTTKLDSIGPDFLKESFTDEQLINRIKDLANRMRELDNKRLERIKKQKPNAKRKLLPRNPRKIVDVLLDQSAKGGIGAGIGNYLVAEILYMAKISPHTTIYELVKKPTIIKELAKAIRFLIKKCYMTNDTGYMVYIKDYLPKHRKAVEEGILPDFYPEIKIKKGKKFYFSVYRQKKDPNGNLIKGEKIINDRTTYWVPSVQVN